MKIKYIQIQNIGFFFKYLSFFSLFKWTKRERGKEMKKKVFEKGK